MGNVDLIYNLSRQLRNGDKRRGCGVKNANLSQMNTTSLKDKGSVFRPKPFKIENFPLWMVKGLGLFI